jgi:hypothetical protein
LLNWGDDDGRKKSINHKGHKVNITKIAKGEEGVRNEARNKLSNQER